MKKSIAKIKAGFFSSRIISSEEENNLVNGIPEEENNSVDGPPEEAMGSTVTLMNLSRQLKLQTENQNRQRSKMLRELPNPLPSKFGETTPRPRQ